MANTSFAFKQFVINQNLCAMKVGTDAVLLGAWVNPTTSKSILDIGRTLEYMETIGIPVVTFGQSEFPSFYSSQSGFQSPLQLNDPVSIARMLKIKWDLGLNGSVLIANPIPAQFEVPQTKMESYILTALEEASLNGISGKHITPFLLKTIAQKTQGESLEANIALVKNNAELGAKIAAAM